MSDERLTDEEFGELSSIANAFLPSRGLSLWCKLLMDRIDDEKELRERRARDLSDEEREALDDLRDHVSHIHAWSPMHGRALAVLDKLLGEGGA